MSEERSILRRPVPFARVAPWVALLLPLVVYNVGFRYVGSGDTVPAELLPISLLTDGNFDFSEFTQGDLPYWFRLVHGHVVSNYPVLPGVLNVPVYLAASVAGIDLYGHRHFLSMLTASTIASLSVLFLYLVLTRFCRSEKEALFFALAYAFGTTVWSVASRALFQHGPSVLFIGIALWALARGKGAIPIAGLALGLAVVNRPANTLIALPLAVYVLRYERRRLPAFTALALLPALFHIAYANAYWGSPFSLAQDVNPGNFAGRPAAGLAGLLVSPSRGLFVFSPFFLFALPAVAAAFRPPPPASSGLQRLPRYLLAAVAGTLVFYSFWAMWWGGHSFGYRLVTEVAPLLTVLVAVSWPAIARRRLAVGLFALCLAFSAYANFLGAMVFPSGFNNNLDLQPGRLWNVRGSELDLSTRKLVRIVAPGSTLAQALQPGSRVPPPAAAWWRPELRDDSIPGWIDGPLDGATVTGPLEVSGWAKSAAGDVEVRLAIAPDGLVPQLERRPRPDVQQAMPQLGDCSRAGWRAVVTASAPGVTVHALVIEMRAPSGKVRKLGPIRFRWVTR